MPSIKLPYFFSLILVCISLIVNAQSNNFDKLTTSSGLSNNTVYSIIQDDLGFIWAGTKKGLNRYDGHNFKQFSLPNTQNQGTTNPTVFSLLIDNKNLIWIGLKDGGLVTYAPTNDIYTRFPFDNNSTVDWSTITVKSLFEDSRNWIWIGTYGGGTIVLNEKREVIFHFCTYCDKEKKELLSNDFVFDFEENTNGDVYIATAGKGLNVFRLKTKNIEIIHSNDIEDMNSFSKTLCLDKTGILWVGTGENGLYALNIKTQKWKNYQSQNTPNSLSNNIVTDIKLDKNGHLWLATDGGGLNFFNPKTEQFNQFRYSATKTNTLNTDGLYDLHFDKSGNLWIGTFNGGINILKAISSPFFNNRQYDLEKKQGLRSILAIKESEDGTVWLGTDGGGVFYFDADASNINLINANNLLPKGTFNDVITCIQPEENQNFWYGSFTNGLNYFDSKSNTIQQFLHDENNPESLIHNNVWDLEIDKNGGLWIGTLGGGVDYLPKDETTFQHLGSFNNQLSDIQVIDLLLDKKNQYLWIATESKGLNRLEIKTNKIKQFQHQFGQENSIQSNNLQALFEDEIGNIWIITDNGLDKLNPKTEKITNLVLNHSFSIGTINSIQEDEDNFIWLSTSTGIHRLKPMDNTIIEFGMETALKNNLYNPKAVQKLSDGRIIFGGVNGFSIIVPQQLKLNNNEAIPAFTDLKIANESIQIGTYNGRTILNKDLNDKTAQVKLSHQDRGITFEFSSTEFTASSLNKYAYKLEGFDKEWHYINSNQRSVFYSNLDGGKYQLKIKAANSSGIWNETARTVDIIVQPPFWETTWFMILIIIAIITAVLFINRFLLNRQKKIYELQVLEQEQEILKQEQEILQLKNKNLEEEVGIKKSELNASILQVAHKNEFLTVLKGRIKKIKSEADESAAKPLRSVVNIINGELRQENYWEQFQLIFNQTFQNFIKQIERKHTNLTQNDHRLCCFIKMKLNNREIASILNITLSAVEQAKYRLKKKMQLEKTQNLNEYIQQFGE
jgi:ligand-binding sensor domain-containing protein/DNA-binding CsgD family transcriptional regulator